ncbi:MAG: peptidase M28 [Gammaproteobacteria bacterium]|nr:MAG: peptidase M28 [Gammaproteobacteria bacterium]
MLLFHGCSSLPTQQNENIDENVYLDHQQVKELATHLEILSANVMAGRVFSSPGSITAQNYIVSSLIKSGVAPFQNKFRHPFERNSLFSKKIGSNIIGFIKGTHIPEQYIVLTAHYDHLGTKGGQIYNGADDNASGVAALLTFGEIIAQSPLKYSVIFLFTDGEEINLLGAKAFINQQKQLLSQIKLNINIDMIAGSKGTSTLHYIDKRLESILTEKKLNDMKTLVQGSSVKLKRGFNIGGYAQKNRIRWSNASDHGVFNRKQIPFIYFGGGVHPNYHTAKDNLKNVNFSFYIKSCQLIFRYLLFFDENIMPIEIKS